MDGKVLEVAPGTRSTVCIHAKRVVIANVVDDGPELEISRVVVNLKGVEGGPGKYGTCSCGMTYFSKSVEY